MSRTIDALKSPLPRAVALAFAVMLVPLSFAPAGVKPTTACASEGPAGECTWAPRAICMMDGEVVNNAARAID